MNMDGKGGKNSGSGGGGGGGGQKRFRGDTVYIKNRTNAAINIDPNDNFICQGCDWCSSDLRKCFVTVNCAAESELHTSERKHNPKIKKTASQAISRHDGVSAVLRLWMVPRSGKQFNFHFGRRR